MYIYIPFHQVPPKLELTSGNGHTMGHKIQ